VESLTATLRKAEDDGATTHRQPTRWYWWLATVSLVGLGVRVAYVLLSERHAVPDGDAFYFHLQANLIANGTGWFVDPLTYAHSHRIVPGADHPPLWTLVLAVASVVGAKSYLSQLLWACVVGTAGVVLTGLAGSEVAGPRVGLLAAGFAALYPNYWLNDGSGLSETLVLPLTAGVILVSYKLWRKPGLRRAAALGLLCALCALTRSELVLLVVLVLVPVCLASQGPGLRQRVGMAGTGVSVALLTMAPWIGFNLARFDHAEFISTEFGTGLASANCDRTYFGPFIGYWSFACQSSRHCGVVPPPVDESAEDARCASIGVRYIERQQTRLPVVMVARVAREFGLTAPIQQLNLDGGYPPLMSFESRPFDWAAVGLGMYYCAFVASLLGAWVLRRRRVTLVPLVGVLVNVVVAAMLLYGDTRFRTPFEVVLAVLAAVALDAGLSRRRRPARTASPGSRRTAGRGRTARARATGARSPTSPGR